MAVIPLTDDVKIFLDELNENLEYLDQAIMSLEKDSSNKETIHDIMGVAHTVKGGAGFLDLNNLVELGHVMESLLLKHSDLAISVESNVIDALLAGKDRFVLIARALAQNKDAMEIDVSDVTSILNSYLENIERNNNENKLAPVVATTSFGKNLGIPEAIPNTVLVRVWVSVDEVIPAIRAFLVSKKLSEVGEVVKTFPENEVLESDEFLKAENRTVCFWLHTDASATTLEKAASVDLIDKIDIFDAAEQVKMLVQTEKKKQEQKSDEDTDISDTVRIPVPRLDSMLNLVGELVIANSGFLQIQDTLRENAELANIYRKIRDRTRDLFRISADIQELVMKSRLVNIGQVFNRFKRFVRDYSRRSEKEINLKISGAETEIDKKIIDEIIKPLTHLVRNALDHGLESPDERETKGKPREGTLALSAYQEGNYIIVEVSDDGRGLNYEEIVAKSVTKGFLTERQAEELTENEIKDLIFQAGFSTKSETNELSGRGIGMDVVKKSIEQLNASIEVDSFVDNGTKITIKLPLTLAILNALVVRIGNEKVSIPMSSIVETQKVVKQDIITIEGSRMMKLRNSLINLIELDDIINVTSESEEGKADDYEYPIIIAEYHDMLYGIKVDEFLTRQEMVIKSLSEHYRQIDGISGASILGDGTIIYILDIHGIIRIIKDKSSGVERSEKVRLAKDGDDFFFKVNEQGVVKIYSTLPDNIETDEYRTTLEDSNDFLASETSSGPAKTALVQNMNENKIKDSDEERNQTTNITKADSILADKNVSEREDNDGIALVFNKYSKEDLEKLNAAIDTKDNQVLMQWIKGGNLRVVEGLKNLTGDDGIRLERSRAKLLSSAGFHRVLGKINADAKELLALNIPILPFKGAVHIIMNKENAQSMVEKMFAKVGIPTPEVVDFEPLLEVTNILGSAYTNVLSEITGVIAEPGLPTIIEDIEDFKNSMDEKLSSETARLLYIENVLYWNKEDFLAEIMIMLPRLKV